MFKKKRQVKSIPQEKLKKPGQSKSIYQDLLSINVEHQAWVEQLIDTILQKGYLPT